MSCNTWQDYYYREPYSDPLSWSVNGTGPFSLEYWYPGMEISLRRNGNYWRDESNPMWTGGPAGLAAFDQVLIWKIGDAAERYNLLTSGAVDHASGLSSYYSTLDGGCVVSV